MSWKKALASALEVPAGSRIFELIFHGNLDLYEELAFGRFSRVAVHSLVLSCLIFRPSSAKLVVLESGGFLVASLVKESASSFPAISVWPGT